MENDRLGVGISKRLPQCTIPGTGKDTGPRCATVKPIDGWTGNELQLNSSESEQGVFHGIAI